MKANDEAGTLRKRTREAVLLAEASDAVDLWQHAETLTRLLGEWLSAAAGESPHMTHIEVQLRATRGAPPFARDG